MRSYNGGLIEREIDKQAERVQSAVFQLRFRMGLHGLEKRRGAFDRNFEYALAFHGWEHDSICIGGSAPTDLKRQAKTAIESAISGSIAVATARTRYGIQIADPVADVIGPRSRSVRHRCLRGLLPGHAS